MLKLLLALIAMMLAAASSQAKYVIILQDDATLGEKYAARDRHRSQVSTTHPKRLLAGSRWTRNWTFPSLSCAQTSIRPSLSRPTIESPVKLPLRDCQQLHFPTVSISAPEITLSVAITGYTLGAVLRRADTSHPISHSWTVRAGPYTAIDRPCRGQRSRCGRLCCGRPSGRR